MNNWLRTAHDWLLPRHCLLCLGPAETIDLCSGCRGDLPHIPNPCAGCAVPLAAGRLCARCARRRSPFGAVHIPFIYAPPVTSLIHGLKFRHRLQAASVLGELLADHLESANSQLPPVLLPVPLHPRRQRQRGFNQAVEIARPLAERFELSLCPRAARRIRDTAAQSGLEDAASRRRNVRGAFSVDAAALKNVRQVAVVDDVVTTGATVMALAAALRRAGIVRLTLISVARAGGA